MKNYNLKFKNYKKGEKKYLQERSYRFSIDIINLTKTFPNKRTFWIIADQLMRSATSVGANIVEAQAASSKRDFIKFFQISLKSANESKYWLSLLDDTTNVEKCRIEELLNESLELSNMLAASLLTLKGKRNF
jgi:four helix bundle protein